MEISSTTGGPAFPTESEAQTGNATWRYEGMTLRDYFAAKVMHQFLAGANLPKGYDAADDFAEVSKRAYEVSDAMLAERSKS